MKVIRVFAILAAFAVCGNVDIRAMQEDGADLETVEVEVADTEDIYQVPTPKLLRPRTAAGWQLPSPQLRNRNNAKENNCGYVAVKVSLHAPFSDGVQTIMDRTKLKGEKVAVENQYLTLFTFNVPFTNDLVGRMPRSVGLKRDAKSLRPDEKKMIADHIREVTTQLVEEERQRGGRIFLFDLNEVVSEDGNAIAYFVAGPDLGAFESALRAIRAGLEKHYRWGRNNQDGVWFDFENAAEVRPSLLFLTSNQQSGLAKFQRALASRLSPRLGRNTVRESGVQASSVPLARSSRPEILSRSSAGESTRPSIASHRMSSVPSSAEITPNRSPNRSPDRSPRDSGDEGSGSRRSYGDAYFADFVRTLEVTGNPLKIDIDIVETESGDC